MRKILILAGLGVVAAQSQALVFNLSTVYTGFTPGGSAPWVTVTITDIVAGTVNINVSHNASSAAGQYVANIFLNLDPFIGSMAISNEVNANKRMGPIVLANNGVNGAAGNMFDMAINFVESNTGGGVNRLKPGEFWSADLTATGLSSASFNELNNMGLPVGSHLRGIGIDNAFSGHISTVPEPASIAALAVGALSLARRRRK